VGKQNNIDFHLFFDHTTTNQSSPLPPHSIILPTQQILTMSVHADPPPPIVSEPHGIHYATANQLGKGGFAICFKAERLERDHQPTGHLVALKIVKSRMEPAKLAQKVLHGLWPSLVSPAHR
jgi:hypothetical protein